MNARYSVIAMLLLFSLVYASGSNSTSVSALGSFLTSYNVSSSLQASLNYTNVTYNGDSYLLAYSYGSPYFLINTTSGYSFVTGASDIQGIISSTIINSSLQKINTTYLRNSMSNYNDSSSGPILDCLQETGLNQPNATCTSQNFCESCRTIPVCSQVLSATGYGSPFQIGITSFEHNYTALESNLSIYFSSISTLSASTAPTAIPNIQKAFANISSITQLMYQNPIFPPPSSSPACNPALAQSQQPWYCVAYGFCQSLNYNSTLLGNMQIKINNLNSLAFTQSQVSSIAQTIGANEAKYVAVVVNTKDLKQRNAILNTTLAGYNSLITQSGKLLGNVSNVTLPAKLNALEANYSILVNNYESANLTKLNSTLKAQYAGANSVFNRLYSNYSAALALSENNTALLVSLESEYSSTPTQVVQLSIQEAQLSTELSTKVGNINSLKANLSSLNQMIKTVPHNVDVSKDLAREVGAPLASVILGASSYSGAVALAPAIAIIPAIIISIVIIALLFLVYRRLGKGRRLASNRRTRKNWKILFGAVVIILIAYIAYSYEVSVAANGSAPISTATAAIQAAGRVAVAINGTSNPSLVYCQGKIATILTQENKTVSKVSINGAACNTGSGITTTDICLAQYASTGVPVIILTNSSRNIISAYSFYGTILSQSGNQQFTNSCLASLFLR